MPKPTKGESKNGLIVTLVIFVLLSIALGVATYYGFAEQQALNDKVKGAETAKRSVEIDRDWQKYQNLKFKALIGYPLTAEDNQALAALVPSWENGQIGKEAKNLAEIEGIVKKADAELKWDPAKKQPAATYLSEINRLQTELKAEIAKAAENDQKTKDATAKLENLLKTAQNEVKERIKKYEEVQAELKKARGDKSDEYLKSIARLEQRDKEVDDLQKKIQEMKNEYEKKLEQANKSLKDMETKTVQLEMKLPKVDMLKHEQPRGKIMSMDRTGQTVYIDLGSADNLKPQTTFSIFARGAALMPENRKGAVEVLSILNSHLAMGRLVDVRDPARDPVLTGDLLYNPAWSSGLKQHIAIAGLIDLTGDGTDATQEFIRTLERQGVVVDSYLDLRDLSVKGKMSLKTNYLVVGDNPEIDPQVKEGEPRNAQKTEILVKMSEMQDEAKRLGITIVPVQRFLAMIGYKLPRTYHAPDYLSPQQKAGAGVINQGEAKEKEGEKKEDK